MKLSDLPEPDNLAEVVRLLADGKRKSAAAFAKGYAATAGKAGQLALVSVLCDALEKTGNSYGKRGKPKRVYDGTPEGLKGFLLNSRIAIAANALADAKLCRDLVDGRKVPAHDLSSYAVRGCGLSMGGSTLDQRIAILAAAIAAEPAEAREHLLPFAKATLKGLSLLNAPRRGFPSNATRKIATRYRVSVDQIDRAEQN